MFQGWPSDSHHPSREMRAFASVDFFSYFGTTTRVSSTPTRSNDDRPTVRTPHPGDDVGRLRWREHNAGRG
jgi:hypothetical protein